MMSGGHDYTNTNKAFKELDKTEKDFLNNVLKFNNLRAAFGSPQSPEYQILDRMMRLAELYVQKNKSGIPWLTELKGDTKNEPLFRFDSRQFSEYLKDLHALFILDTALSQKEAGQRSIFDKFFENVAELRKADAEKPQDEWTIKVTSAYISNLPTQAIQRAGRYHILIKSIIDSYPVSESNNASLEILQAMHSTAMDAAQKINETVRKGVSVDEAIRIADIALERLQNRSSRRKDRTDVTTNIANELEEGKDVFNGLGKDEIIMTMQILESLLKPSSTDTHVNPDKLAKIKDIAIESLLKAVDKLEKVREKYIVLLAAKECKVFTQHTSQSISKLQDQTQSKLVAGALSLFKDVKEKGRSSAERKIDAKLKELGYRSSMKLESKPGTGFSSK